MDYETWQYVGETCTDDGTTPPQPTISWIDPGEGSGGGLTAGCTPEDVDAQKAAVALQAASTLEAESVLESTETTRTIQYTWKMIVTQTGLGGYKAKETGVHCKVNNSWEWSTLTHHSIEEFGLLVGVEGCSVTSSTSFINHPKLAGIQHNVTVRRAFDVSCGVISMPIRYLEKLTPGKSFAILD